MTKVDVELLQRVVSVLFDWSGADSDTPDDTEIISTSSGLENVTLGDLKDASALLEQYKNSLK